MRINCICLSALLAFASVGEAAASSGQTSARSPKRAISIIVLSGVAGAILGLSTLSFYGRPQEKLSNIALGAAVGIIGGAVYTTAKAATEPRDFYNSGVTAPPTTDRLQAKAATPMIGLNFQF